MARLAILALALLAGSACSSTPNRIVGGWPAALEDWNYIVQSDAWSTQFLVWSQSCAANILNQVYVLSAAHCYVGPVANRRIRSGAPIRNTGGTLHAVEFYLNHPSYGQGLGLDGDISLVKLVNPLVYSPVVGAGSIPPQGAQLAVGTSVKHAGWGTTTQGGLMSPNLLETQMYIFDNEICKQLYAGLPNPGIITPNMICAHYPGGGRDACQGDSGGPLAFSNIIVGIVSWGHGCANETYPGVSAAVSSYTNWIVANAV